MEISDFLSIVNSHKKRNDNLIAEMLEKDKILSGKINLSWQMALADYEKNGSTQLYRSSTEFKVLSAEIELLLTEIEQYGNSRLLRISKKRKGS